MTTEICGVETGKEANLLRVVARHGLLLASILRL